MQFKAYCEEYLDEKQKIKEKKKKSKREREI